MASIGCGASLLVLAAALEVIARVTFPHPFATEADLVGMYVNDEGPGAVRTVPGWRGEFTVEGRTVPVALNSLGLRGPEVGDRRPGELRVLCLGDSFVFGYGVAQEEAFPAVLESRLAASLGRPVVCGNAGVPGYGSVEQARCLRRLAPAFDPDVVVATIYLGNDFIDDRFLSKYVQGGFSMTGPWATLLRTSARARFMLTSRAWMRFEILLIDSGSPWALRPVMTEAESQAFAGFPRRQGPNQCRSGEFMDVIDEDRSWEPGGPPVVPRVLATTADALAAIRAAAGRARVLVVLMPSWWHVQPQDRLKYLQEVGLDPSEFQLGLCQQRLVELCRGLDLPVVDITASALQLPDPTSLYLPENRHLNPEGHSAVAEVLAARIADLLP